MPSFFEVSRQVVAAFFGNFTNPGTPASRKLAIVGGFTASGLQLAAGTSVKALGPRPGNLLKLWDFERCPYCRTVRETLSELDLDAEIFPCPKGGTRFRGQLEGGVPRFEDPNTGTIITGSRAIVRHLHQHYGKDRPPRLFHATPITALTGVAARFLTAQRGAVARPSRAPAVPLELWSFESSPYCRIARATLSELELPYVLHNVAKGSPRREAFVALSGKMQVPWLRDPNTGATLFESALIEKYLIETYGEPTRT